MPPSRSFKDIRPEDLVVLEDIRIHDVHFDERLIPYFEVVSGDEILRIRVNYRSPEVLKWLEEHLNVPLDLTIFPYEWEACGRSGVINYFSHAKVR
jgi:hypothetical protein